MHTLEQLLAPLGLADWRHGDTWPAAIISGQAHYPPTQSNALSSPIDQAGHGMLLTASQSDSEHAIHAASQAFAQWRCVPSPLRGELVRRIAVLVRERKQALATLITLESGKIGSEAAGEVQEWIDICDFAVGLSRQLYGQTIASERPSHRLMEQWLPLGPVGVISAFNFPVAVWAWNAMLALVCGDTVIWKPSAQTPLTALAASRVVLDAIADFPAAPVGLISVLQGDADIGQQLAGDRRLPLISATGSVRMGRAVAQTVAARLGRSLLELGGNNAAIVTPSADLDLALRGIVFGAAGTCGQRCTTLRRLIVHESIADALTTRLINAYASLKIGDPRDPAVLVGPLINQRALTAMQHALASAVAQGGHTLYGGENVSEQVPAGGSYVRPAIVSMLAQSAIVREETFAPILYLLRYSHLDEAIALQNAVPQGLSSAIFTTDLREMEAFIGPAGSDCGIANVNAGTSGAEIGGAFGGEKDTGGGRESGSDSWKAYMRRSTNTINYGSGLPLAQGVQF
ncbi:3,6-anhydro-alpha-L-galactose dehydrogenase [Andreprevotia sp. IGB-42]|uniref:L-piperidine-6-carboxylate dehydrogenase n=1 Tax=Andreprevotia sp. IGB-42 TaxID=2497473 RepID=UPI00135A616C|nr:aldehyde dehydrogenase family protein [Andreprevotia sp. IGB-42]KAF0814046.1 3,6-anhydro-alpha-L-galactose dehydrogenase [Andreprevotia sp. IGB-42]